MAPPRGRAGAASEDSTPAEASDPVQPHADALVCYFPASFDPPTSEGYNTLRVTIFILTKLIGG